MEDKSARWDMRDEQSDRFESSVVSVVVVFDEEEDDDDDDVEG